MTNPYARFLDARDAVDVIANTIPALTALLAAVSTEDLERRNAPGKWNVREILCHLADSEIAFGFRLRQTLAESHHVIQPFDQETWALRYAPLTTAAGLDTFRALRAWNLALVANASAEDLERPVTHPERGDMTFRTIVETMAGHDLNHLRQIRALLR